MGTTRETWQEVVWTPREREVIELIGRGRTNSQIADELGVSFATAKWHVSEVISKLGVSSREEVADYWREQRGIAARWRRLGRALAMAPVLKIGFGGTAAAGLGVGMLVAGGWVTGGGIGRAFPLDDGTPVAEVTKDSTAAGTSPIPFETPVRPPREPGQSYPATCPQAGPSPLLCAYDHYPQLAAADKGGCELSGATLTSGYYAQADMSHCDLSGTTWDNPFMNDASMAGADLRGASITGGTFAMGNFEGADLRGSVFINTQLQEANFTNADLEDVRFEVSSDVGTPADRLVGARWMNTTCPDGSNSDDEDGDGYTCLSNLK